MNWSEKYRKETALTSCLVLLMLILTPRALQFVQHVFGW